MRTLIICHAEAALDREGLASWLGSFTDFVGTIGIRESRSRTRRRVAREIERVGWGRFLDVIAFRAYYRVVSATRDRAWEKETLDDMRTRFPPRPPAPEIITSSPNSVEAERFLRERQPDLVIARCKTLLAESAPEKSQTQEG